MKVGFISIFRMLHLKALQANPIRLIRLIRLFFFLSSRIRRRPLGQTLRHIYV